MWHKCVSADCADKKGSGTVAVYIVYGIGQMHSTSFYTLIFYEVASFCYSH